MKTIEKEFKNILQFTLVLLLTQSIYAYEAGGGDDNTGSNTRIAIGQDANASKNGAIAVGQDATAKGTNAVAIGKNSFVKQKNGVAIGSSSSAVGTKATAIGSEANATGNNALALGNSASAKGKNSTALGTNAKAVGGNSVSIGSNSNALKAGAIAIGKDSTASVGNHAIAIGQEAKAQKTDAISLGYKTKSTGLRSVAIGKLANATASDSVALGSNSVANVANTVSVGKSGMERRIMNVAAGTGNTDAVNVSQLTTTIDQVTGMTSTVNPTTGVITTGIDDAGNVAHTNRQLTTDVATNTADIANLQTGVSGATITATTLDASNTKLQITEGNVVHEADLSGLVTTQGTTNTNHIGNMSLTNGGTDLTDGINRNTSDISNLQNGVTGATISSTTLDANGIYTIKEGMVDHATDFTGLITAQGTANTTHITTNTAGIATNASTIVHNAGGVVNGTTIKSNRDLTTKVEYVNVTASQTALGNSASITATNGTAIGQNASVNAAGGTALGYGAVVNTGANNAVAIGQNSVATEANTVSVGSVGDERKITNVATGVNTTDAVNVGQLTAVGTQVDTNTRGISVNSGRISANTQRIGAVEQRIQYIHIDQSTTALGQGAVAAPASSVALGQSAKVQTGANGSMALGSNALVNPNAQNAVALGQYSVANEANTISVGNDTLKRRVVNIADGINDYDAVNMRQFNGLERKMSGIGAMNSAMSALVPNQRVSSDTQWSVGLGYYDSEAAIAGGLFHYINDNILLNAGISYSRESGTAARAGVTWGF